MLFPESFLENLLLTCIAVAIAFFIFSDSSLNLFFWTRIITKSSEGSHYRDKVVWIVGASTGIGEELALRIAQFPCNLILSARRSDLLHAVAQKCMDANAYCKVKIHTVDLDDVDNLDKKTKEADKLFDRKVDIVFLNAGRSQRAEWTDVDPAVDADCFRVNAIGPTQVARALLKNRGVHPDPARDGRCDLQFVVTSSIAGVLPCILSPSYSAAKAALIQYFRLLAVDLAEKGVKVTIVHPSHVYAPNMLNAAFTAAPGEENGEIISSRRVAQMTPERAAELISLAAANEIFECSISSTWTVLASTYAYMIFPGLFTKQLILCIYICVFSPFAIYVSLRAEPLHRNDMYSHIQLRITLVYIILHGLIGFLPRMILIYVQYFCEDFSDFDTLLIVCSILRRKTICFAMYLMLSFSFDRLIATFFWAWYEREKASTLVCAAILLGAPELSGLWTAKLLTYNTLWMDSSFYENYFFVCFLAASLVSGFLLYLFLLRYNKQSLHNLQRRSHFNKYSLNRTYQLKENLVVMKMAADFAIPSVLSTFPSFLFITLFRALPDNFMLTKQICISLFDIWIAVIGAGAVTAFPFFNYRFRKVVMRIPIIRQILPVKSCQTEKITSDKGLEQGKTTDLYFTMLSKEW